MKKIATFSVIAVLLSSFAMGADAGALDKMAAVKADWDKLYEGWAQEARAAKTQEERKEIMGSRPSPAGPIKQMAVLLKDGPDDPAILEYVEWTMGMSRGQSPDGVIEIVEKHKNTKGLSSVVPFLMRGKEGSLEKELFDWARSSSPHKEVQAMAAFSKTMDRGISPEDKKAELEFVKENGGDLVYRNRKIAEVAATTLYADENLVIGKEAPEIEGEDIDGVKFKLSDYRGKVVVLDFWGDW